jgi:hypothetical protein
LSSYSVGFASSKTQAFTLILKKNFQ